MLLMLRGFYRTPGAGNLSIQDRALGITSGLPTSGSNCFTAIRPHDAIRLSFWNAVWDERSGKTPGSRSRLWRVASEHQLTAADCFVIGDSPDDVRAARRLGARGCLVRTGWASDPHVVETATEHATIVADSFAQAVDWILGLERPTSWTGSL